MTMFGWTVESEGTDVLVLDDEGCRRARFHRSVVDQQGVRGGTPHRQIWLERGTTSTVWLPDGPIEVFNGKPWALRRRSQTAQAIADGRLYDFRPDSSRWTHLTRDGWVIARIHRSGRCGSAESAGVITFGELDVTDRLMVVLGQECIGPGRPGFAVSLVRLAIRVLDDLLRGRSRSRLGGAGQDLTS